MVEGKSKRFVKAPSTLVEIEARRSDDYRNFLRNAAIKLNITPKSKQLCLFKCNTGAKLSVERGWTLGSYLRLLKKGPGAVTIGVGCVDLHSEDEVRSIVMEQTGHRSLEGVRSYKRTSDQQREALSDILNRKVPREM